jgi:hypothetical protein
MITTVIGTGQRGDGPDGDPLACKLQRPHGVFIQGRTLYIGDSENHRIRTMQNLVCLLLTGLAILKRFHHMRPNW